MDGTLTNISYDGNLQQDTNITGTINSTSTIEANITSTGGITGNLNSGLSLTGNLDTSSIKGNLSSGDTITGTVEIGNGTFDATAQSSDILSGKTAYARGTKLTGTITSILPLTQNISTKSYVYTIPQGYHKGTGIVKIKDSEQDKIISENIKSGVQILGVLGTYRGLDVSDTTATADTVKSGKIFHNASGEAVTGTYVWNWKGSRPEFISKIYDETITLDDTSYSTWTASTTDTSIKATENITTYVADMANYEYLVRWQYRCDFAYLDGITTKALPIIECDEVWQSILKRPSNLTNLLSSTFNGNVCVTLYTAPLLNYYNTSGTNTITYSTSYGVHPSITAHTFSNSTSDTPTITFKTPAIYVRCSSSYFATARKTYIDTTNTEIHLVGELYRVPIGSTARSMYEGLVNIYNN